MRRVHYETEYKAVDFKILKRLLAYLKEYKIHVAGSIVLTLITSSLTPLRPYLTKVAIDDYIIKNDSNGLLIIIAVIFVLLVFQGLFQYLLTYLLQWIGQNVLLKIRMDVNEHIIKQNISFFDKNPIGRLVTRVTNDVEALNDLFSSGIIMIFANILLIIWIIAFMFFIYWQLALAAMGVLPIVFIVTLMFKNKIRDVFRKIRANLSSMNAYLSEFISGIRTVKLFAQEERLNSDFDELNNTHKNLWFKSIMYYAMFFPFVEMMSAIGLGVIIWFSASNIFSGAMTVGILIAFLQYSEMLFRPIRDLTEKYTTMQSAMAASERIFGILDSREIIEDNEQGIELLEFNNSIKFENISFSYDDEKQVLDNISFEVRKGEIVAIVGATGAGKTSIINILCRFYDYYQGSIKIDNIELKDIEIKSWLEKIALVMQNVFLFSRTVSENISMNENISKDRIINAAKELGAYDFIMNLPGGFDAVLSEDGSTLSSGQRQLLSFCRAYASNPEILILDEATSNIDSITEKIIEDSLHKMLSGRTSIIIAHRLSTIKRANRIIVLHKGKIKEEGTHEELVKTKGLYAKLYKLQELKKEL